ncbi:MAG: PRD domain-containing protein, partial [Halanaerobium sp. MSAO_Bac5]
GEYKKENRLEFREIKSIIKKLEEKYNIQITEDEYAYILEMFKNN